VVGNKIPTYVKSARSVHGDLSALKLLRPPSLALRDGAGHPIICDRDQILRAPTSDTVIGLTALDEFGGGGPDQIGQRERPAAIRHVNHVDAGHHLEQFTRYGDRRSIAGRRHVELAGIGLGVGDEIGDRFAGMDGLTTTMLGTRKTPATGAMSWMKLKLTFS